MKKWKQFMLTFLSFFILGAAFKVMVLLEGFTEVRPVNAIPPVAGLAFGWIGALGCGLGNVAADLFGTLDSTSVLGFLANFTAAFLPHRLWHLLSGEPPNLHKGKNILLYMALSLISALTVAWLLAFGLQIFWGIWIEQIYTYVFWNNAGFSICLGMPVFILLTSGTAAPACAPPPKSILPYGAQRLKKPVLAVYLLFMLAFFVCVPAGIGPNQAGSLTILSGLAGAALMYLLI